LFAKSIELRRPSLGAIALRADKMADHGQLRLGSQLRLVRLIGNRRLNEAVADLRGHLESTAEPSGVEVIIPNLGREPRLRSIPPSRVIVASDM